MVNGGSWAFAIGRITMLAEIIRVRIKEIVEILNFVFSNFFTLLRFIFFEFGLPLTADLAERHSVHCYR